VPPPSRERIVAAIAALKGAFPHDDVDLYLRTLATLDADTWAEVEAAMTD